MTEPLAHTTATVGPDERGGLRRIVVGASVGAFVEWYEFGVYGFLASVMGTVFFTNLSGIAGVLATLAVFGLAFVVRPLGGLLWGHVADRVGRRKTLALTILTTTAATGLIGLLPPAAAIGVAAPALLVLLRLVQGIGASGEVPAAVSFVAEHAPPHRRGLFVACVQGSAVAGTVAGGLVPGVMALLLPPPEMQSWGWRVPFLLAVPLGLVGLYIRRRLEETPDFIRITESGDRAEHPLREAMTDRTHRRALVRVVAIQAVSGVTFYLLLGYLPNYATRTLSLTGWQAFAPTLIAVATAFVTVLWAAWLSDRYGRKPVLIGNTLGFIVLAYPCFMLITSGSFVLLALGLVVFGALAGGCVPVILVAFVEMFPTRVRTSGLGVGYNISQAIFAGSTPFLLTALQEATGSPMVAGYVVPVVALISLLAVLGIKETAGRPLT